ncbi:MAG: NCS2 family permease [Bacteroidales bacterium]|nr:NCS2 family permease [Bacteroidales bacterium]
MSTFLSKAFGFDPGKHTVRTEILAGITTFLTMAYILAVNPSIFSALDTMPNGSVFTATALAAIIGTLVMAFYAKKPFGLAPGMGLNAFFVFTVCLGMGYSWQFALTAIFLEGIIFIILSVTKVREMIVNAIPVSLKNAIGAGIGIYIAFIGLQNAGIIANDDSTLVTLGNVKSLGSLLFIIGLFLTAILVILKVKGGILIGMLATTVIGIPMGITQMNGIVSLPDSVSPLFMQFAWSEILSLDMLVVVLTFLFIDMFDTIGTVVGVSIKSGMVDKDGHVDNINKVLMADAVATTAGACIGASTTTTYIESASGVAEGGRTGLTAFVIAACFAVALLFSPIFLAIPSAATGAVLVIVGVMMMSPIASIDWSDYTEAIPAFVTAIMMPLAYSIAHGIMLGMITYVVVNACTGNLKKLNPTIWVLAVLFVLRYIFM